MISSTRPKEILEAIEKERVTTTILVVAQLQQIVDYPELNRNTISPLFRSLPVVDPMSQQN